MFSQYSWGDFIKVVLLIIIPYYAFVLWKYYREDIRELLSNRGQNKPAPQVVDEDDEEPENDDLFPVRHYESAMSTPPTVNAPSATQHEPKLKPGQWLPEIATDASMRSGVSPLTNRDEPDPEVVELQGPELDESVEERFAMPIVLQAENAQELSLDEVISAAGRIVPDEQGVYEAAIDDEPATRIAQLVNQQKRTPLDSFAFNR